MIDLQQQVCNPDLAHALRNLKVKQDSLWWYDCNNDLSLNGLETGGGQWAISAFTVAELGHLLAPYGGCTKHGCGYWYAFHEGFIHTDTKDENEANARARLLIFLIKDNQIILD